MTLVDSCILLSVLGCLVGANYAFGSLTAHVLFDNAFRFYLVSYWMFIFVLGLTGLGYVFATSLGAIMLSFILAELTNAPSFVKFGVSTLPVLGAGAGFSAGFQATSKARKN